MKSLLLCLGLFSLGTSLFSQSYTLELRPGSSTGIDATLFDRSDAQDNNYTNSIKFQISEWTGGGARTQQHQLLGFNLDVLPDNALITSAKLSLYHDPDNADGRGVGHYGDVATELLIQRVTEAFDIETVTWGTRPSIDTIGQVLLPGHTEPNQDYEDIDVTDMVSDMFAGESYGLYFQMAKSDIYQMIKFASSNHPDPALHPKLVVTYTAERCGTFRIGENSGQDANSYSRLASADNNYGASPALTVYAWTSQGAPTQKRAFLDFDLSSINPESQINSAELFLYYNPFDGDALGVHAGDNSLLLSGITEAWSDSTLTWNNRPAVSEQVTATVPATEGEKADILGADVTELIQNIRANDLYGFSMQLQTEEFYRNLLIASGDHPEPAYRPTLKVCWDAATDVAEVDFDGQAVRLTAYPNPSNGLLTVDFSGVPAGELTYVVADLNGRQLVAPTAVTSRNYQEVDLRGLPRGIYLLTSYLDGRYLSTNKLILQAKVSRP